MTLRPAGGEIRNFLGFEDLKNAFWNNLIPQFFRWVMTFDTFLICLWRHWIFAGSVFFVLLGYHLPDIFFRYINRIVSRTVDTPGHSTLKIKAVLARASRANVAGRVWCGVGFWECLALGQCFGEDWHDFPQHFCWFFRFGHFENSHPGSFWHLICAYQVSWFVLHRLQISIEWFRCEGNIQSCTFV